MNQALKIVMLIGFSLAIQACGDEVSSGQDADTATPVAQAQIEVAGTWTTPYGEEVVSTTQWNAAAVVDFDNEENWAITQNAQDAQYSPGAFNKLLWTERQGNEFYYCIVDYDLASAAIAYNSERTADATAPAESGCGSFAWTQMTLVE